MSAASPTLPAQPHDIELITLEKLHERVRALRETGHRLVQISVTPLPETFELTYSFDFSGSLASLRLQVPRDIPALPSISPIFGAAVLYENEIHDLFGITIDNMTIDFRGNFYKTAIKYPMTTKMTPPAAPKPVPKAAAKPAAQ
ncbi:MAG TPA: NADH-quinone oxidoreductase subunit C [Phycisphaerae bacterium]|jgi:ech hydrogenase subunit D|nr:NADH-quinone oxidoreductase subunit C [Phycisphaerae bacterium]